MKQEAIEKLGAVLYVVIALILVALLYHSKRCPRRETETIRAFLWAAFICFTFVPVPVGAYGVIAIPFGWYLVVCIVGAFVVYVAPEYRGLMVVPLSVAYGVIASLFALFIAALVTFRRYRPR